MKQSYKKERCYGILGTHISSALVELNNPKICIEPSLNRPSYCLTTGQLPPFPGSSANLNHYLRLF